MRTLKELLFIIMTALITVLAIVNIHGRTGNAEKKAEYQKNISLVSSSSYETWEEADKVIASKAQALETKNENSSDDNNENRNDNGTVKEDKDKAETGTEKEVLSTSNTEVMSIPTDVPESIIMAPQSVLGALNQSDTESPNPEETAEEIALYEVPSGENGTVTSSNSVAIDSSSSFPKRKSEGKKNYAELFEDTLFMGDSLTEPLLDFEYLLPSSVIASKGDNLLTAASDENMETVKNLRPRKIVLLFGLNDVNMVDDEKEFLGRYVGLTDALKKASPDSLIYIVNVTKVAEATQVEYTGYRSERMKVFNDALSEFCKENGFTFIDVDDIIENNPDLYQEDGIHLYKEFYPMYLDRILEVMGVQ